MQKEKADAFASAFLFGDPDGNRTRVTAVKGRCLSRLTTGPLGTVQAYHKKTNLSIAFFKKINKISFFSEKIGKSLDKDAFLCYTL